MHRNSIAESTSSQISLNRDKVFIYAFAAILLLHLLLTIDRWHWFVPLTITKALLAPTLVVWLLREKTSKNTPKSAVKFKMKALTLIALVFSWIGDVALAFEHLADWVFLLGLSTFLIAHLFYTWSFALKADQTHNIPYLKAQPWVIFIVLMYGAMVFLLVMDNLGEMLAPVLIYILIILTMLLASINRASLVERSAFFLAFFGSMAFAISDTIIAYGKFVSDFALQEVSVMLLYGAAQILIVFGALKFIRE